MTHYQEKLQIGLERLRKAGQDPEILGYALMSLHGALEDYFRELLSSRYNQQQVLERKQVQWKELLDLMQQYEGLSQDERKLILNMNSLRQEVAHGGQFTGTRSNVEAYANYVQQRVAQSFSSARVNATSEFIGNRMGKTAVSQLSIPEELKIFTAKSWMHGTIRVVLDSITGEIIQLREQTKQIRISNARIQELVEQKIWLKLSDGKEEYLELVDFHIQARQSHVITVLIGCSKNRCHYIAVLNHMTRYTFYKKEVLRTLLDRKILLDRIKSLKLSTIAIIIPVFYFSSIFIRPILMHIQPGFVFTLLSVIFVFLMMKYELGFNPLRNKLLAHIEAILSRL